ncbi:menaquinol-cytochrome c reductase cytochrome b/c subunit [Salisediminibacterium halotolerans]|uniref:menaquinol-cytochrome c reductase cytochrome b/c subunit n=1 Tax=Salisediminibacterium halotolerans TaxID=517425 RepID=UPI000EABB547|nr:menaquinol-cytochrome c reductase cytochrome b/c subunit [Salisediminibacterium halotolerans]RLJ77925.1 menaquinol-cytochrome c reductase cytochrome b/c subunit [Actinophytocola xinjiangensis]RPE88737.1 menaquinol-cytochrome c reductase cytochrome b/c subunit [Salisediminibacterium halotolerans]TWG36902.1 menaquinol-cytochrome c reductase cytochrome b/c subunit [Salisediminibacterium halotolerans]GEL07412.1 menaquinol-cytochrome c reductase cytochrome b/c subunit [Salisediminibacterium halot
MQRGKGLKFVGDSRLVDRKKQNIPKDYSEYPGKTEAFWPNFLLREWMVGSVFLIGFLILTVAHPAPLERVADPMDSGYIPLPDWYFLFLYQLLKYEFAAGDYTVIGAVVIPGIAFGALLLAPWIDPGKERRPQKRPIGTSLMLLAVVSIIYLTWESVDEHDWEAAEQQGEIVEDIDVDESAEGYEIYQSQDSCIGCHGGDMLGGAAGPNIFESDYDTEQVIEIIEDGIGEMPGGQFEGSDEELETLAEFIANDGQENGNGGDDGNGNNDE